MRGFTFGDIMAAGGGGGGHRGAGGSSTQYSRRMAGGEQGQHSRAPFRQHRHTTAGLSLVLLETDPQRVGGGRPRREGGLWTALRAGGEWGSPGHEGIPPAL